MNTMYKKIFAIIVIISSSVVIAKNNDTNMSPEDKTIALQFAPITPAPFSQDKDDQYFTGLLSKIIKVDEEIDNNPRLKLTSKRPISSLPEFIAHNKGVHTIVSKNKSFGWNDPLAIVTAMFYNGIAETPNELITTIEKSVEFPGKYKAVLQGRGLYSDKKTAHSEFTDYIKAGPAHVSKYAKLEEITTLQNLYDFKTNNFKKSEKEKLEKDTPSVQGEVTCNCYSHGCDLNGVIYFDELTLVYLMQQQNGNRHLHNTVKRTQPIMAVSKPVQVQKVDEAKPHIELIPTPSTKVTFDQKISQVTSDTVSDQEKELLVAMNETEEDNDTDIETDEDSELDDDKE